MSGEIKVYENENFGTLRCVSDDSGESWIVATDLAKILGYRNAEKLTRNLDADEKGTQIVGTPGGEQRLSVVNEAGFYRAVINRRSKYVKDEAAKKFVSDFQHWVTHEVLPSIRKHGGYMAGQEQMTPEEMALASMRWLESKVAEQKAQIKAMEPKALFADAVVTSNTSILVGELAKILKQNGFDIGQNRLFELLRKEGYLIGGNRSDRNMPTQKSMELDLFEIKERTVTNPDGTVRITKTPKVTGKGQVYFVNRYCGKRGGDE